MKWQLILLLLLISGGYAGCSKKQSGFAKEPHIEYRGISTRRIQAGSSKDTLFISFRFRDGDADLGNDATSGNYDIFLTDERDGMLYTFFFPRISDDVRNPERGMEGECTFFLLGAFITLRPDHPDLDTVRYSLYIRDRAGNQSNTVYTEDVYLSQ
jgi:hypothetical protein